ncbi:CcdC family protein [Brevibacillus daliensis]|uniref:CcdC family protein n=1 Tax=Brevibacillus daliensis TaxID=2892995 RepID=UPI001E4438A0|nr:cytochrome c biogenesis protein CcdC [Brevibacillus daliensis]
MPTIFGISLAVWATSAGLIMASFMFIYRIRAAKKPVTVKKILIPPIAMSTGFGMFIVPDTHLAITYHLLAFCCGMILSIPLIMTSRFEKIEDEIYLRNSILLIVFLLGALVIRSIVKVFVGDIFTYMQTAGLFFVLAFGMIMPWRVAMFFQYKQLFRNVKPGV